MKKKLLAVSIVVVLLVVAAVGSTLAYFTDKTDAAENTFTVGKVKISLDEAKVDESGATILDADGNTTRVKGNEYKLVPSRSYDKDPTVHVLEGSEKCFIRAYITIDNATNFTNAIAGTDKPGVKLLKTFGTLGEGWTAFEPEEDKIVDDKLTIEFRYATALEAGESTSSIISGFKVPETIKNGDLTEQFNIEVYAEAIQAENLTYETAFSALDKVDVADRPAVTVAPVDTTPATTETPESTDTPT
jgi:predicted ribosomally synthesized peptide with SipW-like signal peptide